MVNDLLEQALGRHRDGDLAGAAELYRQALAADPENADAHHLLGLCAHGHGDHAAAVAQIGRAVAIDATVPAFFGNLGLAQHALGDEAAAGDSFRRALELDPGYQAARYNLASLLAMQGQHGQALRSFETVLAAQGPTPELLAKIAESLAASGEAAQAVARYRQALELAPGDPDLLAAMSVILDLLGEEEEALAACDEALRRRPDFVGALVHKGKMLRDRGQIDAALAAYNRALELQPDAAEAAAGLANTYERSGDVDRAWDELSTAVARNPDSPILALAFAAQAPRRNAVDEALATLQRCETQPGLPSRLRRQLLFARARLLDAAGRHAEAFAYLERANETNGAPFDIDTYEGLCVEMQAIYAAPAQMPHAANTSERPVFIVGMPRSGTSLVEQILASHPDVFGAGELSTVAEIAVGLPAAAGVTGYYPEIVPQLSAADFDGAAAIYLQRLQALDGEAARVTDKMPTNFLDLGLIRQILPKARIIHIRRNPLDTCLSCYFQDFGARLAFTGDLDALGRYYVAYDKLLRHWRATLEMLEVRYEDLVDDPQGVSRTMVDYVGLPWNSACLNFHNSDRFVRTASYDQVRRPIYRDSLQRWRPYASQLEPLRRRFANTGLA